MSDIHYAEVLNAATEASDTPEFQRYAMLVIGAAVWGPDPESLARITGFDRKFVDTVAIRMAASGLWTRDGVVAGWADGGEDSGIALQMDILVAAGLVTTVGDPQ